MNIKKYLTNMITAGKPKWPVSSNLRIQLRYIGQYAIFAMLYGCSLVYRILIMIRLHLYRQGSLKRATLSCPVISIGNITTGGTGKTPLVIQVAQMLRQHGKRIVILSRGYRPGSAGIENAAASLPASENTDPSGSAGIVHTSSDVRLVGDEPLLIARKLQMEPTPESQDVTVIVGRKRSLIGQWAIEQFQPDVILLDDGFQHLQLQRTCDIVLIDATNPFGGGRVLPAGLLREPLRNLARAHAFVITRSDEVADIHSDEVADIHSDEVADITSIRQQVQKLNSQAPIFTAQHTFDGIRNAATGEPVELSALKQTRFLAVSGLGNPASFHRLLNQIGLTIEHTLDFPDHHWYSAQDIDTINRTLREREIAAIATTEKDEVKLLLHASHLDAPVYTMTITVNIEPETEFETLIVKSVDNYKN